jgi:hypothetical protein
VCSLWWLHHRVFARLFYPNTLSQAAYALSIGIAFCLLAVLFARGSAATQTQADETERRDAGRTALRVGLVGIAFLISAVIPIVGLSPKYMSVIWFGAVGIAIVLRARDRLASRPAPASHPEPTEPVRPAS